MELREKLRGGYHDDVTLRLMKVLSLEQADVHLVQVEIQKLEEKIEWMEKKLRTQNLANWRRRLQGVPGFDTIDLSIIRQSLPSALPALMQPWIVLLISQWSQLTKWISINGHVEKKYSTGGTGIPQADAASPLILSIFLWQGYEMVGDMLKKNGQALSLVYMDDRTIIADAPDVIAQAVVIWKKFAGRRKLLENQEKAQWCSVVHPLPFGYQPSMGVLGAIIGSQSDLDPLFQKKQWERISKAGFCVDRIAILPEAKWKKWMTFCSLSVGLIAMVGWLIVPIQRCKSSFFRKPSMLSAN